MEDMGVVVLSDKLFSGLKQREGKLLPDHFEMMRLKWVLDLCISNKQDKIIELFW